ncbi:Fur family transcriptional regulator [Ahrensia kielensis]|uniref:Fur family transcriptional regulator n=1 Tax=Ahrensia kielensis TaxID=76980 RepID=A0ABU9T1Y9_9HYPH
MGTPQKLTKNQSLVLGILDKSEQPLSAYTILDSLRSEGLRAPLQVYRALDALVSLGNVHRLESLNAFVACSHAGCSSHSSATFIICKNCGIVAEIYDDTITSQLHQVAEREAFSLQKTTVELHGICASCQNNA